MTQLDTEAVKRTAVESLLSAVRRVAASRPKADIYAAIFHEFYGDGTQIFWPCVTVATRQGLAEVAARYRSDFGTEHDWEEELRWSGADLPNMIEPTDLEQALANAAQEAASSAGDVESWEQVYDNFLHCFPTAAKMARDQLVAEGTVSGDFIAIASDEAGELIPLSLSENQLALHFPELDT